MCKLNSCKLSLKPEEVAKSAKIILPATTYYTDIRGFYILFPEFIQFQVSYIRNSSKIVNTFQCLPESISIKSNSLIEYCSAVKGWTAVMFRMMKIALDMSHWYHGIIAPEHEYLCIFKFVLTIFANFQCEFQSFPLKNKLCSWEKGFTYLFKTI